MISPKVFHVIETLGQNGNTSRETAEAPAIEHQVLDADPRQETQVSSSLGGSNDPVLPVIANWRVRQGVTLLIHDHGKDDENHSDVVIENSYT